MIYAGLLYQSHRVIDILHYFQRLSLSLNKVCYAGVILVVFPFSVEESNLKPDVHSREKRKLKILEFIVHIKVPLHTGCLNGLNCNTNTLILLLPNV